jgi:hypothetical protein
MNAHSFLGFAWLGIELNPHNPVHGSVGGNLGPVRTAGLDPLFYLHHANIDRYWECWLRKDDRNENISSSETFHFQSLSGPQTVSVNSALRTEDLGYTYDVCPGEWRFRIPGLRYLFFIDRRYLLRPFPDPPAPWERFVLLSESFGMNASDSAFVLPRKELELGKFDGSRPHAILLRDVEESKLASEGGFFLEAWLAPDAAQLPKVGLQDAVRIGTLGKFELSGHDMHAKGEHQHLPGVKFKLSPDALKRLDGKADPAVVFVRHGIVDKEGKPFDYDPKALLYKVGALALVAQKS